MKISQKILLYMLPLVILPLMLLGSFSYYSTVKNTQQQAKSQLNGILAQNRQTIENYYRNIESIATLLGKSRLIEQYINSDNPKGNQGLKPLIVDTFSQYASSYQDFYEIRLLNVKGLEAVRFTTDSAKNLSVDESQTDYFEQLSMMAQEQGMFYVTNPDNDELALLYAKKLYAKMEQTSILPKFWGYLLFTVRPSAVIDVVHQNYGSSGVHFITNDKGMVLFSAQSYLQGTLLPPHIFNEVKAGLNSDNLVNVSEKGIDMQYQAARLNDGHLLFIGIAKEELSAEREILGVVSIVTTFVVVFMVPFLLYYFLKTLVLQPIAELTMAKRAVGKGNLDVHLDVQQQDEIGELYSSFNVMVRQLKAYRQREEENKVHLEEKIFGRTKALKDANRELENSNQALLEARQNAEMANELKSTFLANMSHEIRTPLTAIIGFTEQAMSERIDRQEQLDFLGRVQRSGQHLLHLINDILDLSKIEADKLELEYKPINLFELLNDIESINVPLAQEKALEFAIYYEFPLPQIINGDLIRLRQILLNLCSNAVKFTRYGDVSLTVSFDDKAHEMRFSVQDSGIGMSDKELSRLFQPFVQADSSITRKFGGSGLGLVISKKLTQLMHGNLTVESIKGLGSRFDVILPAGNATLNMVDAIPSTETLKPAELNFMEKFGECAVLVAEDNVDNQYLIELLLSRLGVECEIVDNGIKAVESAISEHYDLILMDIQMPQMGGSEAVELLRQSGIDCPIIALTANIMKEDIDEYLRIGFDDTLAKPIQQENFFAKVSKYLNDSAEDSESIDLLVSNIQNDSAILQLKDNFKAGLPDVIFTFKQYLKQGDWENLKAHAHIIKGSAGSLGYPQLTEKAASIERFVSQGDIDQAAESTQAFIALCESCAEGEALQ